VATRRRLRASRTGQSPTRPKPNLPGIDSGKSTEADTQERLTRNLSSERRISGGYGALCWVAQRDVKKAAKLLGAV
jgi:hypothetical protein